MDAERLKQRILVRQLGTEEDLKPRKLSIEDWRGMNAELQEWHIATNGKNVDEMFNAQAAAEHQAQQNEINSEAWESKRIFENRATQGDIDAGLEQVALFTSRYPQFVGAIVENRQALMAWLKQNNRTVKFANLVAAFEALTVEGRVIVSPSAIGAGPEHQVSGLALRDHPNLHLLLKPGPTEKERERREIDKLSAH